jgi:hypothetical protein
VSDALIVPHYPVERQARGCLQRYPEAIALDISDEVALALGPDGEVATGDTDQQVMVTRAKFALEIRMGC